MAKMFWRHGDERVFSIAEARENGGYIIAGINGSNDGDVTGFHGMNDYWVVKLDTSVTCNGKKVWVELYRMKHILLNKPLTGLCGGRFHSVERW